MKYVGKQLVLYIYTYHILYLLSKYFCIYYAHLYLYFIAGNSSFKNQLKTRTLLEVSRKTVVRGWVEKKNYSTKPSIKKWYITSLEEAMESFHDRRRTLHNNGWDLLCWQAQCVGRAEWREAKTHWASQHRRSKPLLCNVRLWSCNLK